MARLNAANPTVLHGRQSSNATRVSPSSFKATISSPLRSRPKQQIKKSNEAADFKIFEDEETQSDSEKISDPYTASPRTTQKKPTAPLKLTHTNSITSGLSKRASQDSAGSSSSRTRSGSDFDEDENSDKENIFFDDEAEEASDNSEEEEDEEHDEVSGVELNEGYVSLAEDSNLERDMEGEQPGADTPQSTFMQYRETNVKEELDDSQSEASVDSDDGYNSLEDFIVSDNEDLSYYDDGLEDEEEEEQEEIKPPTPKPSTRRKLIRGRRPRTCDITAQTERLNISNESRSSPNSAKPTTPHDSPSNRPTPTPPRFSSSPFTRLLPNEAHEEARETTTKDRKVKRSPLRESINSMSSIPAYQENKMQTPPTTPSKNRLLPSKTALRIPPSPHRQSSDAFWNQEATNAWNDECSPPKQRTKSRALDRFVSLNQDSIDADVDINPVKRSMTPTPSESSSKSPSKSPSKTALKKAEIAQRKEAVARKKVFDDKKHSLAQDFLIALDQVTSGGQVNHMAQSSGGIKIQWSKTLRSTAGRARWSQEKIRQAGSRDTTTTTTTTTITYIHHASIELAEHIIDDENRLLNTLAHEYCHLANYMISGVRNQPHGASFKEWGTKCVAAIRNHPKYKDYPIEVTTRHAYEIDYKYVWLCIDCGHKYGRHSKSIDPTKSRCSLCKGGLQQVKPKPRNVSPKKNNNKSTTTTTTTPITIDLTLSPDTNFPAENMINMVESLENTCLS